MGGARTNHQTVCRVGHDGKVESVAGSRVLLVLLTVALVAAGCGSSGDDAADGSSARGPAPTATSTAQPSGAGAGACAKAAAAPPERVPGAPLDTILRVPASARGHRAPLVLALHFASGTGAQMEQAIRLTPQARRSGFVVAYPSASANHFWAIDTDLPRLSRTLDAIERVACIDPARVYVTGMSNGGFMSAVLACRMADRVAAAALFAPGITGIGECAPSRPISVLEIHGTADPIVPYRSSVPERDVPAFIAGWARRDGCSATSREQLVGVTLTRFRWPGCRAGVRVEHLRLSGGRHVELFGQLRAAGADGAREAWRFLASNRLPRG
jgi:polyhydroxybutyrate depolymerase